jgi:hypothetical protein
LLFRECWHLEAIEFLTPDCGILPQNRTLRQNPSHTFGPGDVRLIEDTTGKGHTTTYLDGLTITMQIAPNEG